MLKAAMAACKRYGHPVSDSEYGSSIGDAVWRAATRFDPSRGIKPTTLAVTYALRACSRLKRRLARERTRIPSLIEAEIEPLSREATASANLSRVDFELLSYVAAKGLGVQTAKDLGMRPDQLRERIDRIKLRVKQAHMEAG